MASTESNKKSVLFVCTGNTCRSPMAEGLLKAALAGNEHVQVGSAGVAAMPGQGASSETLKVLEKYKVSLDGFRSRQVDTEILDDADVIIAMTHSHAEVITRHFPEKADAVCLLTDFIDSDECLEGEDVPDPIGLGMAAYEEVADVMALALPGIIDFAKKTS